MNPLLMADGGDLTVGRRVATYVYGNFNVIIPDDRTKIETDDRLVNGYIAQPSGIENNGRFDLRFKRSDATIDIASQTSDLKESIDAAQKIVDGDTFFERDITDGGLGRLRPGIDFKIGDMVNVLLWGKQLPSQVTAIDMVNNNDSRWRIHVGGQIIRDPAKLKKHNDALLQQIASEKQKRLKEVGAAMDAAHKAQGTADKAQTSADKAQGSANKAQNTANNAQGAANKAQNAADNAQKTADKADKASIANGQQITIVQGSIQKVNRSIENEIQKRDKAQDEIWKRIKDTNSSVDAKYAEQNTKIVNNANAIKKAQAKANDAEVKALDVEKVLTGINTDLAKNGLQGALTEQLNRMALVGKQSQSWINANQAAWNTLQMQWNSKTDGWKATQEEINLQNEKWKAAQEEINRLQEGINTQNENLINSVMSQQKYEYNNRLLSGYVTPEVGFADNTNYQFYINSDGDFEYNLIGAKTPNEIHYDNMVITVIAQLDDGYSAVYIIDTNDINFKNRGVFDNKRKIVNASVNIKYKPGTQIEDKKNVKNVLEWDDDIEVELKDLTFVCPKNGDYIIDFYPYVDNINYWDGRGANIYINDKRIKRWFRHNVGNFIGNSEFLIPIATPIRQFLNKGDVIKFTMSYETDVRKNPRVDTKTYRKVIYMIDN